MIKESELDYLRRRAAEELDQADRCVPAIAQIHRQLAVLYENKVAELRHLSAPEMVEQMATPQPSTSAL